MLARGRAVSWHARRTDAHPRSSRKAVAEQAARDHAAQLCVSACESAQVVPPDAQGDPRSRLLSEHLEDRVAGRPVDLNARCGIQGLRVRSLGLLADHVHVKLHGVSVGVNLDDPYLCALLVEVLIESDQSRLVRLNEVTEPSDALPLLLELALLKPVCRDEDDRPGHALF